MRQIIGGLCPQSHEHKFIDWRGEFPNNQYKLHQELSYSILQNLLAGSITPLKASIKDPIPIGNRNITPFPCIPSNRTQMKPFMFGYHEIYFETFHIGYNGIHVLMLSGHYVRIMQQRNSPVQPKKKKKRQSTFLKISAHCHSTHSRNSNNQQWAHWHSINFLIKGSAVPPNSQLSNHHC